MMIRIYPYRILFSDFSEYPMNSSLQARTFGSESSPYDDPRPLFTWNLDLSEEELQELQTSVVEEFRRCYEKNGLSDLIKMREYLSKEKDRLRRLGNGYWNEVSHLQRKVSGGKSTEEPTEREENRFNNNVEKAGDMHRKADVIEYRLDILKNTIWEISVNGKISKSDSFDARKKSRKNATWDKTRAVILSIHEEEGLENIETWNELYYRVKIRHHDNDRGADGVRRYLDRNLDGGRPEDPEGMIGYVEKWSEEEEVRKLARRYEV